MKSGDHNNDINLALTEMNQAMTGVGTNIDAAMKAIMKVLLVPMEQSIKSGIADNKKFAVLQAQLNILGQETPHLPPSAIDSKLKDLHAINKNIFTSTNELMMSNGSEKNPSKEIASKTSVSLDKEISDALEKVSNSLKQEKTQSQENNKTPKPFSPGSGPKPK